MLTAAFLPQERSQASIEKEKALLYARRYPIADEKLLDEEPPETPLGERPPPCAPPDFKTISSSETGNVLQVSCHIRQCTPGSIDCYWIAT